MDDFSDGIRAFSFPTDVGITPLPIDAENGLCTSCEGRPAHFAVKRAGEDSARRLCNKCLSQEFAPAQPRWSEILERVAQMLSDAERTATPKVLGEMSEHLAEWWESRGQPVPDFVTEFIERHRASAPPLAAPVPDGEATPEELQAARLALLLMRGAIARTRPVNENRYIIEPDSTPISRDDAADILARMPKPLSCQATVRDGVMAIRCRSITEPAQRAAWEQHAGHWEKEGGYFPNLRREHGDRYAESVIFCLGWRESLVARVAEVERYQREYDAHPAGYSASPPSAYLATEPEAARAAHAIGAVYFMKCHSGEDDRAAIVAGLTIEVRDTATWDFPQVFAFTPGLGVPCENCGERRAAWRATDTRTDPWLDRTICEVCTAAELAPHTLAMAEELEAWVSNLSEKGRRSVAEDITGRLEDMERWWQHLPIPAEVAVALQRCRQLRG
jgi:protein-arginine kinase activator protein McsA